MKNPMLTGKDIFLTKFIHSLSPESKRVSLEVVIADADKFWEILTEKSKKEYNHLAMMINFEVEI